MLSSCIALAVWIACELFHSFSSFVTPANIIYIFDFHCRNAGRNSRLRSTSHSTVYTTFKYRYVFFRSASKIYWFFSVRFHIILTKNRLNEASTVNCKSFGNHRIGEERTEAVWNENWFKNESFRGIHCGCRTHRTLHLSLIVFFPCSKSIFVESHSNNVLYVIFAVFTFLAFSIWVEI